MEYAKEKCKNLCKQILTPEDVIKLKQILSELSPDDQFTCYDAYLNNKDKNNKKMHDPAYCLCIHKEERFEERPDTAYCSILDLLPESFIDYEMYGKWNILHFAAQSDKARLVEKLVADHGKLEKLANSKKQTPLILAVKNNPGTSRVLLKTADPGSLDRVLSEALDEKTLSANIDALRRNCTDDKQFNSVLKGAINKKEGGMFNAKLEIVTGVLDKMKTESISVTVEHLKLSLCFPVNISTSVSEQLAVQTVSPQDYIAIVSTCLKEGNMGEEDFRYLEAIIDADKSYHNMMFDNISQSNFSNTDDNILKIIASKVIKGSPVVDWYNTQDPRGKDHPLFEILLLDKSSYLSNSCIADSGGETLGHHAASNNNTFLLMYLYQHRSQFDSILSKEDREQKKPLYNYPDALDLLSKLSADELDWSSLRNVCGKANQNILQRKAQSFSNDQLSYWRALTERDEFSQMFQDTDRFGNTLLHYALSSHTHPTFLKVLLTRCKDCVNVENNYGRTPLHFVVKFGETGSSLKEKKVIKNINLLKDAGADINLGSTCTPYKLAIHLNLPDSVTELLATTQYTEEELELDSQLWFLEEAFEREETVEVVWIVGHVECEEKEVQIELLPGGDWLTHYRHYANPILALWEGLDEACMNKERLGNVWVSKGLESEFTLERGKCIKVTTTMTLNKEQAALIAWLKELGMMGVVEHSGEDISDAQSVMSYGDVFERFTKDRLQSGTEESVRILLEKLTSLKLVLSLCVHGTMYLVNVQRFVQTMQCQHDEVTKYLKMFLGADLWGKSGDQIKSKKEPAYSLSLALYHKDELQSATLLYQPLTVALIRILAPNSYYRAGDSIELYLGKGTTVNMTLVTTTTNTTVTVTTDSKAFTARLVYAMSLALHQTQLLSLNSEFKVKFLCPTCLQDSEPKVNIIGEMNTVKEVGEVEGEEVEYEPSVLDKCSLCNTVHPIPSENKSKPNAKADVMTRLSNITLAHQVKLHGTDVSLSDQDMLELQSSFSLPEPYLKVQSTRCRQTALFYSIVKQHGNKSLSAFYRENKKEFKKKPEVGSTKEVFALDLLTIHGLEGKHTVPWHEKFHYRWLVVTAIISLLMFAIVVGVDKGFGFDLGYTGLTVIPAVVALSGTVYALKLRLKGKKVPVYEPVEDEEEEGGDLEQNREGQNENGDQELANLSKVEKFTNAVDKTGKAVGKVGSAAPKIMEAVSKVSEMV